MSRCLKYASWLLVVLFPFAAVIVANSQQNPKRLVLKDGSYQTATKWEITGERVRYFSADRYAWEELPKDLVDWPATDKYNQEHEKQRTISAAEVAQQEQADRQIQDAATPMVAPGLRLPDGGGVFLLDVFSAQPQLVELAQDSGNINKQSGKNILRAAVNPLALSSKQTIEIDGPHAHVQAHELLPVIFVNVDKGGDDNEAPPVQPGLTRSDHYRIIRLEMKKGSRVVAGLNVAVYGKISEKENWVPTNSGPVGDWIKVTPTQPLQPGEYALVEMLENEKINVYVWDFGVNRDAPRNAGGWTGKPPQTPQGDPGLAKRPTQ